MGNICKEHGVEFFKTAKMKQWAHPIEGTEDESGKSKWCNEPLELDASKLPAPKPMPEVGDYPDKPPSTNLPLPPIPAREKDIHRQVALKAAIEAATHGLIKLHHVLPCAEKYRRYLDLELNEAEIYSKEE